jgi:tRNA threonylcarbamoyladenosine biosynthesis protein TsaE
VAVQVVVQSASARQTKAWGRRLGTLLKGGEIIGLHGELGAGKTCFVKGLARGLGLSEEKILSPTFTMIQEHASRLPLYHIDLYRLEAATLDDLGLREYLFSQGVAAVEWFERLQTEAALDYLSVRIAYAGASRRLLEFSAAPGRHQAIVERLRSAAWRA